MWSKYGENCKLPRVCSPKPCLQYACSLVCDVIDFICDLKLIKSINRSYYDAADSLLTFNLLIVLTEGCMINVKILIINFKFKA